MIDSAFSGTGPTITYNPLQRKVIDSRLIDTRIPSGQTGAVDRNVGQGTITDASGQVGCMQ